MDQIKLTDLPSKADEKDVQKMKLKQEELIKQITELAANGARNDRAGLKR